MLAVEDILTDLGIEYRQAGPENVKAFCINPHHEEKDPSMHIHKELGIINCFGCGFSGNIFSLLAHKGFIGVEALVYLERFPAAGYTQRDIRSACEEYRKTRGESPSKTIEQDGVEIPIHRKIVSNAYLEGRGITAADMKKWKMGVITGEKNLGWVIVPIYQDGKLCNYFMRSTFGQGKLYGSYPRKHILAGLDFCTDYNKIICLSEGIFDAISVSHAGFQSVACLSNTLLQPQLERLKKYKEIAIVPDNDAMGLRLVDSAGPLLHSSQLWVFPLPAHRKDAGECSVSEILQASMNKVSWIEYVIMKKYT